MTGPGGAAPAPVGGGAFDVDIARAPQAIRELEGAMQELRAIQRDAITLAQVDPPALDQVSLDAAGALGRVARGGPHSFNEALAQGIAELERMITALQSGFDAYRHEDDEGRAAFSQAP